MSASGDSVRGWLGDRHDGSILLDAALFWIFAVSGEDLGVVPSVFPLKTFSQLLPTYLSYILVPTPSRRSWGLTLDTLGGITNAESA